MKKIFYGEDENQFGELRLPEGPGPHPVAIVIHGGFWRAGYGLDLMKEAAEDLTNHGWATWNIEYRRINQTGGAWPGTLTDVAKATDYVRILADTNPLDLKKVISVGHSAGGHLALWIAARHRLPSGSELYVDHPLEIAGTVSLAGVSDLEKMYGVHHYRDQTLSIEPNNPSRDLIGGTPDEQPERYKQASPIELLPLNVPQVLIHGSLDIHVPIGISDHYFQWAENMGDSIKYVELADVEHFMLTDTSTAAWERVREEMELLVSSIPSS